MDDIKVVEISLYFPTSLILSEGVFKNTRHKKILCTVEIRHFGRFGDYDNRRENGIVKSLRVVFIKDANTLDWMNWPVFMEKIGIKTLIGGKRTLGILQEAIANEVINKLGLTPAIYRVRSIVPRDILTEVL